MQTFTLCHCVLWLLWIKWKTIKPRCGLCTDRNESIMNLLVCPRKWVRVYAWTSRKVLMDSQDVEDHAHRPHVHLRAVGISPQDLWSCRQKSLLDTRWPTEALTESFWNPTEQKLQYSEHVTANLHSSLQHRWISTSTTDTTPTTASSKLLLYLPLQCCCIICCYC